LINFTEFLEVHQPVHVVAGGERAGLAFPVLTDAAFEVIFLCARRRLLSSACAALRLVGNAGIERSRETAHDIHVVVMLAPRVFGRKDSGFFARQPRARMTEGVRPSKIQLSNHQCPAAELWDMISLTRRGGRESSPRREAPPESVCATTPPSHRGGISFLYAKTPEREFRFSGAAQPLAD
jgi:hypothetical protein